MSLHTQSHFEHLRLHPVRAGESNISVPTRNTIINGDCVEVMGRMSSSVVDFILTDPPYITRYQSRTGQRIINDDNAAWLRPAFAEMHRVLKPGSFCISFYGWNKVGLFADAWQAAGFRIVGHMVFRKRYASSETFFRNQHEQAYLLAKGRVNFPSEPLADVIDFAYTGNRLHPTQKPVASLKPLVDTFCRPHGLVLDHSAGRDRHSSRRARLVETSSASNLMRITIGRQATASPFLVHPHDEAYDKVREKERRR